MKDTSGVFDLHTRSSQELRAVVQRFEAKWELRRRRAHKLMGISL